jgi:large subunit ribosomal protein L30
MANEKLAIIRVRGKVNINPDIKKTFELLKLSAQNTCVIVPSTPVTLGMARKLESYTTYGTVNAETLALLNEKRKGTVENVFKLSPPRKGYGRKGIKKAYSISGALGNRKDDINELIQRMI